jgi:hypothetical protein
MRRAESLRKEQVGPYLVQVVQVTDGTFGWVTTNTLGEVVDFGFEKCPTEEWAYLEGTRTADWLEEEYTTLAEAESRNNAAIVQNTQAVERQEELWQERTQFGTPVWRLAVASGNVAKEELRRSQDILNATMARTCAEEAEAVVGWVPEVEGL